MASGAIVVTGASRGIGGGIAIELVRRGFEVACLSRSGMCPQTNEPLADELQRRLIPFACDMADEAAVGATFRNIATRTGGIGGLVNNAGIHSEGRAASMTTAEFERVMRFNTTAVLIACREAHPYLVARKRGIIVNIGSFFEKLAVKGSLAYCASKAAVGAITRCLAAEWGADGISVLGVSPGYIETDINRAFLSDPESGRVVRSRTFTKRAGQIAEVSRLIAAIFVEDIPFLTGETIYLDGGQGIKL